MDSLRKKELKEAYSMRKPEMGIVEFKCKNSGKSYLAFAKDTRVRINSLKVRLNAGMYSGSRNKNIQKDWNEYSEQGFETGVIDVLKYDKDDEGKEYGPELEMLLEDWLEKIEGSEIIL